MTVTLHQCGGNNSQTRKCKQKYRLISKEKEIENVQIHMCMYRDNSIEVDVSEPDFFRTSLIPRWAVLLKATSTQVNKARRKHGDSSFR